MTTPFGGSLPLLREKEQALSDLRGRRGTLARIARQELLDQLAQRPRDAFDVYLAPNAWRGRGRGRKLKERDAEPVEIRPLVRSAMGRKLGCELHRRCARRRRGTAERLPHRSEAETEDLHDLVAREEEACAPQLEMQDACGVRALQPGGDLDTDACHVARREPATLAHRRVEREAVQKLQREEVDSKGFAGLENLRDVGMLEGSSRPRLAQEQLPSLGIAVQLRGQPF